MLATKMYPRRTAGILYVFKSNCSGVLSCLLLVADVGINRRGHYDNSKDDEGNDVEAEAGLTGGKRSLLLADVRGVLLVGCVCGLSIVSGLSGQLLSVKIQLTGIGNDKIASGGDCRWSCRWQ